LLDRYADEAQERREYQDAANEDNESEVDLQEKRDLDSDSHSACKRSCMEGTIAAHPKARSLPDSIVNRGISDDNCKRACSFLERSVDDN
jgi:hypothetical protein